jgi:hypothetical protein
MLVNFPHCYIFLPDSLASEGTVERDEELVDAVFIRLSPDQGGEGGEGGERGEGGEGGEKVVKKLTEEDGGEEGQGSDDEVSKQFSRQKKLFPLTAREILHSLWMGTRSERKKGSVFELFI